MKTKRRQVREDGVIWRRKVITRHYSASVTSVVTLIAILWLVSLTLLVFLPNIFWMYYLHVSLQLGL